MYKTLGKPLTLEQIKIAVENLYGEWSRLPNDSITFIEQAVLKEDYTEAFEDIRRQEQISKVVLQNFEQDYPDVLGKDNLDDILTLVLQKLEKSNS